MRLGDDVARDLPWRRGNAWGVLVSEVMLQQTPVGRVKEPWRQFMSTFPRPSVCAAAGRADVLRAWGTLGYPRRAVSLHRTAVALVERHHGRVPSDRDDLLALPGVGPYTARAVRVFAFGLPDGVVDVNVHRVLARYVAHRPLTTSETQRLADDLVDPVDPARYTQSLLDLGAQFCRSTPRCDDCPARRECAWRRSGGADPAGVGRVTPPFRGSRREARGRLLARLRESSVTRSASLDILASDREIATAVLDDLEREGLVSVRRGRVELGATT